MLPAIESAVGAIVNYLQVRPRTTLGTPFVCSMTSIPLQRSYFDKMLPKCLQSCGLDSTRYKGHYFRIEAATYAAEQGMSGSQIRTMGRCKSYSFQKYIRPIPINRMLLILAWAGINALILST
ncbi:Hypothetical predicted protein [Mytilus galloprovincialis]|uniref:Tyr recombinase domain-containing protein n=1 Tax=Mytilus galloprovincialis TaxID=29158 RepID=A0A8B6BY63_MYTGA|nr:Hypothetical predicted protein [Mytilus galloprovincialis]